MQAMTDESHKRPVAWAKLGLVLALVAIASAPKFGNAFVWDDVPLIVDSDFLHDLSNVPRTFLHDTMFAADGGQFAASAQVDTYRPVTMLSFFVDSALSGRDPVAYHWDNLLLHLLCTALVFVFASRLLPAAPARLATWVALWFGLQPALSEAHVWINGRSDLWCTFFGLLALLLWWRDPCESSLGQSTLSWPRALAVFALCLLGLLSKETLAPALVVALIWDVGFFHMELRALRVTKVWVLRALPLLLAVGCYVALRSAALSGLRTSAGSAQLWMALRHLPMLLMDGLVYCVAPLRVMPRYLLEEYSSAGALRQGASLLAMLMLAVAALRFRRRAPFSAFGLAWFVATLAPASLISTMAWYGFGRYLYLPFALLIPCAVEVFMLGVANAPGLVRVVRPLAIAMLVLFGARLATSAPQWDGSEAFYAAIVAEDPLSSHGTGGLGKWLAEQGKTEEAIPLLERAVSRNASDPRYLNNLALSYLRAGRAQEALGAAVVGTQRFPNEARFHYAQAKVLVNSGTLSQVVDALVKATRLDPQHRPTRSLIVDLSTRHPAHDAYRAAFASALGEDPSR